MKNKAKLLGVRPFNMANFSSGSGYFIMSLFVSFIFTLPASLLLWGGMALPLKTKDGTLDYQILKRRLIRIALPICLVVSLILIFALDYFFIWIIAAYCALFLSALLLNLCGSLSKGTLLFVSAGFGIILTAVVLFLWR